MKPSELNGDQLNDIIDYGSSYYDLEYEGTGPGKFEGNENPALAERIWNLTLEGQSDEETGDIEWGWYVCRLGRFIVGEDDTGFVSLAEFRTEEGAIAQFNSLDAQYAAWLVND